jgi:hypothetical protein
LQAAAAAWGLLLVMFFTFGDLHGSFHGLSKILKKLEAHHPELVIVSGDLTDFGSRGDVERLLRYLPSQTYIIPGNCDPPAALNRFNLHGKRLRIGMWTFVGWGGSNPTPFNTPLEYSENDIYQNLSKLMVPGAILVVHCPPYGHLDFLEGKGNLGSVSIKRIVARYSPPLVISGHIHEARGVERKNGMVFVNAGAAKFGFAALIELPDTPHLTDNPIKVTLL